MTKFKKITSFVLGLTVLGSLSNNTYGYKEPGTDAKAKSANKVLTNDYKAKLDANGIEYWFVNNGQGAIDPFNGNHLGLYFPKGTPKSVIYTDGFVWSGYVQLPDGSEQLRSGGATYAAGLQAGPIVTPGFVSGGVHTEAVAATATNAAYRIWKIQAGWQNLPAGSERDALQFDWENWPFDQGAPAVKAKNGADSLDSNGNKIPRLLGAQTAYFVANDMSSARTQALYGSLPMGLELQVTNFMFNQKPFNTMVFTKRTFINKSGLTIKDMYVSAWSDPDLGNAGDDLVGVDVGLKLGYIYNATNFDTDYNQGTVPAGGYVFFQGPRVVGAATDTALFDGTKVPGFKNLGLSSFAFYINGGPTCLADPPLASPNGTIWLNLYQRGFNRCGDPQVDRFGTITNFPYAGPAENRAGDVDGFTYAPGDRRLLLSSGPFDFAPGDIQEVVTATIVAQGTDNLQSVVKLRKLAVQAQKAFDKNFVLPGPPPDPIVRTVALDTKVVLDWSVDANVLRTENDVQEEYRFEGYRVFQLKSPSVNDPFEGLITGEAVLIGTYDKANLIMTVVDEVFDDQAKADVIKPVVDGKDEGLIRQLIIETDFIENRPLINGREYYYAVTAYNVWDPAVGDFRDVIGVIPTMNENQFSANVNKVTVIPRKPDLGVRYGASAGTELSVTKIAGVSDGVVKVIVADPTSLTGATYNVEFYEETNVSSPSFGKMVYNVRNMTTNQYLFPLGKPQYQTVADGVSAGIYEGLQIIVTGPALTYKDFQITANANGALNPPSYGAFAFNSWGFPNPGPYQTAGTGSANGQADRPSNNSQASGKQWGIHRNGGTGTFDDGSTGAGSFLFGTTQYTGGLGRPNQGIRAVIPDDYEFRWTGNAEVGKVYNNANNYTVPFQVWNTKGDADPSNDFRVLPGILDGGADGVYRIYKTDHALSGGDNDPQTDPIYLIEPLDRTPGEQGFNDLIAKIDANPAAWGAELGWAYYSGPDEFDQMNFGTRPSLMRLVFVGFNLISITAPAADWDAAVAATPHPENGTVFKIVTTKPNIAVDKFAFTAPSNSFSDAVAKKDIENISVFPNPYFGASTIELSKYNRKITFTGLPTSGKTSIRIFTLSGIFVREIDHTNGTQFEDWNMTNSKGLPVASGMYVVHITTPFGEKILKLAIIQETQYLDNI